MEDKEFYSKVNDLAIAAHAKIMNNYKHGISGSISVCGIDVTGADDLQSVKNRFSQKMRRVEFDAINKAHAELCGEVTA